MVYLPDHSHCKFCGNPTPFGEDFCDEDCKALFDAEERVEKMKDWKFYGLIGGSLVVIALIGIIIKIV